MIHAQLKYNLTLIMLMVVGLGRKSYSVSNRVILDKSSFRKKALTRKKKGKKRHIICASVSHHKLSFLSHKSSYGK